MPAARNRTILTLLPHTEPTTSPHPSHVTLDDAPARLLSKRVDVIVVDAELPFPDEALRRLVEQTRAQSPETILVARCREAPTEAQEHAWWLIGLDGWVESLDDDVGLGGLLERRRAIASWRRLATRRHIAALITAGGASPLEKLAEQLARSGFEVCCALSERELLRLIRIHEVHLLITPPTRDPSVLEAIMAARRYLPELQPYLIVPDPAIEGVLETLEANQVDRHMDPIEGDEVVRFLRERWTQWLLGPPASRGWNVSTALPTPMRVLVVDDDPQVVHTYVTAIGALDDFEARGAAAIEVALETIEANGADLILVGLDLPNAPGIQAFVRLRSARLSTPLVVLTHAPDSAAVRLTVQLGAQDVLESGAPPQWLASRLRDAYERHRILNRAQGFVRDLETAEESLREVTAQLKLANLKLEELASRDPLTGLLNRRGLEAALIQIAARRGAGEPLAALLIDLDDFKAINEGHGHAVGDEVLEAVAERLLGNLRPLDTCARVGGDEFLVLLGGADVAAALEIAERLREEVALPMRSVGRVTISIGVAPLSAAPGGIEAILRATRAGLTQSKQGGKNRVARSSGR